MLRVVENTAVTRSHSVKVIRIYTVKWGVCKFLLVFHMIYQMVVSSMTLNK